MLRTNTRLTPLRAMLRYRRADRDRAALPRCQALLETRPIFHQTDATIRGHVFCSFLALILAKAVEDRLATRTVDAEWADILADIDRLQEIKVEQDGKQFLLRTPTTGCAGKVFQASACCRPTSAN